MKEKPRRDFCVVFENATGFKPFSYQVRLAESESFPKILNAPTGSGKTEAVILAWLWKRRFADEKTRADTPRRIVYCLPMRVLVEQTAERARKCLEKLDLKAEIAVTVLMGGEDADDWDGHPERDTIIIGTQDMLLSRALNRGYGMSRYRWPVHYALLNNDCFWVMDEIQLMGVGVETSAQLQAFRGKFGCSGNTMTLWMSATVDKNRLSTFDHPAPEESTIRALGSEDESQIVLKKRLSARKQLKKFDAYIGDEDYYSKLAKDIVGNHREGTLSLAIVNTVERARKVYREVEKEIKAAKKNVLHALIHSRFRQNDREENVALLVGGEDRIVVATQVVEAGVDVSAARLFTELSPWPSLVQRFGRCNRYGEFDDAEILWIDSPTNERNDEKKSKQDLNAPYDPAEMDSAKKLLVGLEDVGINSLKTVGQNYLPSPTEHQVIRKRDMVDLFDTTPDLTGNDLDVSRYIRESNDTDVQVFWKKNVGEAKFDYKMPAREELCSIPIGDAKKLLGKTEDNENEEKESAPRKRKKQAVSFRRWNPRDKQLEEIRDANSIVPGQVLLLDCTAGGYDEKTGWDLELVSKNVVEELDGNDGGKEVEEDSYDSDRLTCVNRDVLLNQHTRDVEDEVSQLSNELELEKSIANALNTAAEWHDIGKSHDVFQKMLRSSNSALATNQLWVKSKQKGGSYERKHFRHELASALAYLQNNAGNQANANLIAYLIAAHHGKVRLLLRSLPGEKKPPNEKPYARGVWDGDELPQVPPLLPHGIKLDLSFMELGEGSWLERTLNLRNSPAIGPFRLAYYEMLLRIADWRASKKEAEE